MQTRRIRLRLLRDDDLLQLYLWRNTEKFRFLFHHNEEIINLQEFQKEFKDDSAVREFQFAIEKVSTQELIGLTFVHTYSKLDRQCFLNIFLSEQFEKKGYAVDTFVLFGSFLFNETGIQKIFVEAFEYNTYSIGTIRNAGMVEMDNRAKKKLHNGQEYKVILFCFDIAKVSILNHYYHILNSPK